MTTDKVGVDRDILAVADSSGDMGVDSTGIRKTLQGLTTVVAPTTLFTVLLYYFGWARTSAQMEVFNLDHSTLGFSTSDYLLRSVDALFIPLGGVCLFGIMTILGHRTVVRLLQSRRDQRTMGILILATATLGILSLSYGFYSAFRRPVFIWDYILTPLSFAMGFDLFAYAHYVHDKGQRVFDPPRATEDQSAQRAWLTRTSLALLAFLNVLSLFWFIGNYAAAVGRGRAVEMIAALSDRTSALLYSPAPLDFQAHGVIELDSKVLDSPYRFRYHGLKLLLRSSDKYFLLPACWEEAGRQTILLPDSDKLRLELLKDFKGCQD
jgi:hypothetical protein